MKKTVTSAQIHDLSAFLGERRDQNILHCPAYPAGSVGYITLGKQMTAQEMIEASRQFARAIDAHLDGLALPSRSNERIAIALFQLAIEHFNSSIILLERNLGGSASALVRLQYEAFIRGLFYRNVASDIDAQKFIDGGEPPKIKDMIAALEGLPVFNSGILSAVHKREWSAMNSFTHGGTPQVVRRFNEGNLVGKTSASEVKHILKTCQYTAYSAAFMTAEACKAPEVAKRLSEAQQRQKIE